VRNQARRRSDFDHARETKILVPGAIRSRDFAAPDPTAGNTCTSSHSHARLLQPEQIFEGSGQQLRQSMAGFRLLMDQSSTDPLKRRAIARQAMQR
jgi:hypothetical protein